VNQLSLLTGITEVGLCVKGAIGPTTHPEAQGNKSDGHQNLQVSLGLIGASEALSSRQSYPDPFLKT